MNGWASSSERATTVVYVITHKAVNARIRSLAKLGDRDTDIVFVTSRPLATDEMQNLAVTPYPNPTGVLRKVGLPRLAHRLDALISLHNRHRLYVKRVVRKLREVIREDLERGSRVVLLTCVPPHALAVVGQQLKRSFPDLRWVIDWQDLWSADDTYFGRLFPPYRPLARRLERRWLSRSDVNVTTNEFARRWLEEHFELADSQVRVVSHHAAAEPSSSWAPVPERMAHRPRLVFMGRLFKGAKVPGRDVIRALQVVRARNRLQPELHLYGRQGPEFESHRPEPGVQWHGVVEHAQVMAELRKYDYLLLLLGDLPNSRLIMHLKLSEYLVAGPPILAIVPSDSAVADIIRRTGTGVVVPAEQDWAEGLERVLQLSSGAVPSRVADEIDRFSWRAVSREWRSVLGVGA